MFLFNKIEGNDIKTDQFEITGSTYSPDGDLWVWILKNILIILSNQNGKLLKQYNTAMCILSISISISNYQVIFLKKEDFCIVSYEQFIIY